jgi:uncharacterized membrane protein
MSKCLIAEYETNAAAKVALEVLEQGGFTLEQVSVVSSASDRAAKHLSEIHDIAESSDAPDGRSTSLGMLIGGTVAAPIAAGTLIGPLIVAGPLVGMAIGAAIGSLLSSMEHWGVEHHVSADYEQRVNDGSTLLIVHDVDDAQLAGAEALLKPTDPKSLEEHRVD